MALPGDARCLRKHQCGVVLSSNLMGASWLKTGVHTMRFGSTAKVLLRCKLKYYRISEWSSLLRHGTHFDDI